MASLVEKVSSWWHDIRGDPTWTPAEEFAHLTQFDEGAVKKVLCDLDTLAATMGAESVRLIQQDYHCDDKNANEILTPFCCDRPEAKTLMIENPYKGDAVSPHYKIDHHWCNHTKTTELEVNPAKIGIPSSSSTLAGLLWQKIVQAQDRPERRKNIPAFERINSLAIEGLKGDWLEPECGLGAILTAQLLDTGAARLCDWPLQGWGTQAQYGVLDFIHHCDHYYYKRERERFLEKHPDLTMPAKSLSEHERKGILDELSEIAGRMSVVPAYDQGRLQKKGLYMGGKEVHDDTPYFESSNELLAIQREFYKLADMPKKAMNLRNPRCRIRQASSYNLIDFQQRITMERFYLGFTRFTRMTDNRRIPAWYLPLIIMQPITINNRTDNVLYAACHPIYHGVPGFSIGKLLVELAEKFPQASAGGSEQIGGIRLGYENPYNALSQFSELLNTAVPKDIQAGRIPEDVQKDALKMVQNPTLYERFNNAYI